MHELLNRYRIRSTIIVGIATWMLIEVARWSMVFAGSSNLTGVETAAIIAAVQGPATLYAGWAFKIFQETKSI